MEVIGVFDAAAAVTYVSPSVERVFGCPPGLLIGTNAMDYVHPATGRPFEGLSRSHRHLAFAARCRSNFSRSFAPPGWRLAQR